MILAPYIIAAHGLLATTYGWSEMNCGDIHAPRKCELGATTASGLPFDPNIPFVAIAAPADYVLRPTVVYLKTRTGRCHALNIIDKMNPRYIGIRGFDLSPAAVTLLTGKPAHPKWQERLYLCSPPVVKSKKMRK